MSVNSKAKGNAFERKICEIFRGRFNAEFNRVPASGAIATSRKELLYENARQVLAGDIITPPHFKFSIEAKSRKEFSLWELLGAAATIEWSDWWHQSCQDAAKAGQEPLVIVKYNNRKILAFLADNYENYLKEHSVKYLHYENFLIILLDNLLEFEDRFFWHN